MHVTAILQENKRELTMDNILTIISAICTLASIIGAHKSVRYYRKSKQLTIYANTNVAFIETQKIISTFTEILKLSNPAKQQRGTNLAKQLETHGESIKTFINIMREKLSAEDFNDVKKLFSSHEMQVESYIDSFISGTVLIQGRLEIDEKFNSCQQIFYDIQQLLKKKIETVEKNLS